MTRQLLLLVRLRGVYLWRAGLAQRIFFVLTLAFAVLMPGVLAVLLGSGLSELIRRQSETVGWEIVHLAAVFVSVIWLWTGSFADLYDPGRLAPFPVRPPVIFLGATLGGLVGMAPILMTGLGIGLAVGVGSTVLQGALRVGLFLLLAVHLEMLGRVVRLAFLGILTSRRWRDVAVLTSMVFGMSVFVVGQLAKSDAARSVGRRFVEWASEGAISAWISWLPPVWVTKAARFDGWESAGWLAAFLAMTAALLRTGGWLERRLALSEPVFQGGKARADAAAKGKPFLKGLPRWVARILGPEAGAVARKELAVLGRDPIVRYTLVSLLYFVMPALLPLVLRDRAIPFRFPYEAVGFMLLLGETAFLANAFGLDGVAVRTLFAFPAARWRILAGKTAAYLAVFLPLNAVVLAILASVFGSWTSLPVDLAYHLGAMLALLGTGAVASVVAPRRLVTPGVRLSRQEDEGCLTALRRLAVMTVVSALLAPVAIARWGLREAAGPAVELAVIPAALAYGAVLYVAGLALASKLVAVREEALGDYFKSA